MDTKTKVQNRSTKDDAVVNAIPLACSNEKAAVEFMEKQRWGDRPACPTCGSLSVYQMQNRKTKERQANFRWRCNDCKDQYTVRKGTVLEDSAIPYRHWCYAFWRAATSKKGVSALEIKRHTALSYKSSLFLLNRIRHAMEEVPTAPPLGSKGEIVEVDETYWGRKAGEQITRGVGHKHAIVAMIERKGRARSFVVANVTAKNLKEIMFKNISKGADLMTDQSLIYAKLGQPFNSHHTVNHSIHEYVRGHAHTNTAEGFFSNLKRGLNGIYHSVSAEHLHRYLAEFDFRYSHRELSDGERTALAIKKADGKRLTYKPLLAQSKQ